MNINQTFQLKNVRKTQNLDNVYICASLFVMSRTYAQNGLYNIFKRIRQKMVKESIYVLRLRSNIITVINNEIYGGIFSGSNMKYPYCK